MSSKVLLCLIAFSAASPEETHRKYKTELETYLRKIPTFWEFVWKTLIPSGFLKGTDPEWGLDLTDDPDNRLRMYFAQLSKDSAGLYQFIQ